MKTKTLIVAFAAVALIVAFAVRATRQISQTNAVIATLAPQCEALREKAGRMETRLQLAREAVVTAEQKSNAEAGELARANQDANTVPTATAASVKPVAPVRVLSLWALVANDPHKMAEFRKNFRADVERESGGMFKALGLSREQIEKFKDVEVWLQESGWDLWAAIDAQGLDPNSAEYKKLWSEYYKLRRPKEAEVMGDLAARYREYYRTQEVRDYAQQLAWTGVFAGESVTSTQVEHATDILVANSKRTETGSRRGWVEPATINWAVASVQLKEVLSPAQIETLGLFVEKGRAQTILMEQTARLTAQFKGQPPPK